LFNNNLVTLKVFKAPFLGSHFCLSMVASLAVYKTLVALEIPKLSVKWPNDILSENKKICGILIENVIKKNNLNQSVIGIGLNGGLFV